MAGERIPGSFGITRKPSLAPVNKDQLWGDGYTPGALKADEASTQGPRLRGWPRAITWDEFREIGSRPSNQEEDAQIETTVAQPQRVRVVRDEGRLRLGDYVGTLRIVRGNSWVVTSKKTASLLQHEQGHFDISGLVARDLMTALRNLRVSSADELQRQVTRLYSAYDAWGDELSDEYDEQTAHGRTTAVQAEWESRIQTCIQQGTSLGTPPA